MKKYLLIIFVLISSLFTMGWIGREDDPLKTLLSKLERFRAEYPQEKVHLHLDKPYYTIGDTIWFKAYVAHAERNQLSLLSRILYVDLINDKDSIKQSLRMPLNSGTAWGDFTLSDTLREGNYRIRAYTNWMRNFGEEYYFDKTVHIGNVLANKVISKAHFTFQKTGNNEKVEARLLYTDLDGKALANKEVSYEVVLDFRSIMKGSGTTDAQGNIVFSFVNNQPFILKSGKINTRLKLDAINSVFKSIPVQSTSGEASVQFFPEGGQLVDSIRARVAFKAINASGLGIDVSGFVTDQANNRVAEFKQEHAGMGTFIFYPTANSIYTATVKFADGSEKKFPLPRSSQQGYVLTVNTKDSVNLGIRISASGNLIDGRELTLVAQSNHVVHYVSKSKQSNAILSAVIPKKRFPTGIVQLTLFSADNQPLAERLVYIRHNDQLNLAAGTDKALYAKKEKVNLTLNVANETGQVVQGSFSVSVTNSSKVPIDENNETTIYSNLLLSSDIQGYIENPAYYFTDPDPDKNQHLDNLMLTQGWRRFSWKAIVADNFARLVFRPEQNLTISGSVSTPKGKPVAGGKITLFSTSGDGIILDTVTDAAGRFAFDKLGFAENTAFVVQARDENGKKNVEIELDRVPSQLVTKNKNSPDVTVNASAAMITYLQNRSDDFEEMRKNGLLRNTIIMNEIKVTEKKSKVKYSTNLNGAGNADAIITADQLTTAQTLAQALQGRVAGLVIQNGIAYLTRNMYSSLSGRPTPMQLVVDGMNMEPDMLTMLNPQDVESIEILKSIGNTAIYGINGAGGVMVITTKRGERNMSPRNYAPGILSFMPKGYYLAREFYHPDYENPATDKSVADLRTTIYWNPSVINGTDGKSTLSFFTPDSPGRYRVVIEGIGVDGKLGRKVCYFTVN